jgi:hypothetical protein
VETWDAGLEVVLEDPQPRITRAEKIPDAKIILETAAALIESPQAEPPREELAE